MRLRDNLDLLEVAVSRASEQTGIPIPQIRKDFWLTEALRAAVTHANSHGTRLVLKGGTSLSKVFRVIERFSEDVDLLIIAPGSKAAINTAMKGLIAAAEQQIGVNGTLNLKTVDTGAFREVRILYPGCLPPDSGLLLEVGSRGGAIPNAEHDVTSIVAPRAAEMLGEDVEEATPFAVHVLAPSRTLVEKLVIVHEAHHRTQGPGREQRIVKTARHYYDIWCLLGDPIVREEIATNGAGVLAREVCQHSKAIGLSAVAYPTGGFSASAAFDPKSTSDQRKAYQTNVPQLLWPAATMPTFAACLARVAEHRILL
jgi:Nucleotidyl transferase AbiEii toxin, Type IV TA system